MGCEMFHDASYNQRTWRTTLAGKGVYAAAANMLRAWFLATSGLTYSSQNM